MLLSCRGIVSIVEHRREGVTHCGDPARVPALLPRSEDAIGAGSNGAGPRAIEGNEILYPKTALILLSLEGKVNIEYREERSLQRGILLPRNFLNGIMYSGSVPISIGIELPSERGG